MTVTLHLPASPVARSAMLRRVVELAGTCKAVRSGHGGLVVSDDVALAYLAGGQSAASGGQISHTPMPADLARLVRGAEDRAGLVDINAAPIPDSAPKPRTAAARRPRRSVQQQGATTHE